MGKKKRRTQTSSPAVPRRSSSVSCSDPPREQKEPDGEDAVMEDCTESHQSEFFFWMKAEWKVHRSNAKLTTFLDLRVATIKGR